jgi:hypothetical protein
MWRIKKRWWILGAALIAAAAWESPIVPKYVTYCQGEGPEEHCPTYEVSHFALIEIGNFLDRHSELITAIATIALVWSTILLWGATKRTAELAERSLTELEAPTIFIDFAATGINVAYTLVDYPPLLDSPTHVLIPSGAIKWKFVNYGRTPARILHVAETIQTLEIGNGEPEPLTIDETKESPWGLFIPPDGKKSRSYSYAVTDDDLRLKNGDRLSPDDCNVFFSVVIRYADIFGNSFRVGACFILSGTDGGPLEWMLSSYGHPHNYLLKEEDSDQ